MGQQQILLIILGIIITAVAIAVGIAMFGSTAAGANKDALVNDLANLSANAYQYKLRLSNFGGGGGSYIGYAIPGQLQSNDNGSFEISSTNANSLVLKATSSEGYGTVTVTVDSLGGIGGYIFTDQFQ